MPSSKLSEHVSGSHEKVRKKSKKTSKTDKSVELSSSESNRENINEVTQNTRHRKILKHFLDDRPQLKILKSSNDTEWTLRDFNDDEEELWVVHCPSNIDINQLHKASLTLPEGKSIEHHSVFESKYKGQSFECNSQLLNAKKHLTLICQTNGLPEAFSVKQTGLITIHEKIDLPNDLSQRNTSERVSDVIVEYPKNLKIRHPLFGYKYDEETMKEELVSPQKKNKKKRHSQEYELLEVAEIKREISTSPKKLKRKHEEAIKMEPSDGETPKKKKSKRE